MIRKLSKVLMIVLVAECSGSLVRHAHAGSIETWNDPCQRLLTAYRQHPGPKAFALTTNSAGSGLSQYCGAAWRAGSRAKAESKALADCKAKKIGKEWNSAIPQTAKCRIIRSE